MPLRRRESKGGPRAAAEPAPQYFQVTCPDGHRLRGLRTGTYQALRCPECGNGVFVLPRSPLPEPPTPTDSPGRTRTASRRPAPQPVADESIEYQPAPVQVEHQDAAEIVWDDELPTATADLAPDDEIPAEYRTPRAPEPPASRPVRRERPAPAARPVPSRRPSRVDAVEVPSPEGSPPVSRRPPPASEPPLTRDPAPRKIEIPETRRRRPRLGLVIVGALLLAGGTAAFRLWQAHLESLPAEAEENWNTGLAALDAGDFDAARQSLNRAVSAFDRLGGRDPRTPEARQLAREAAIFADALNVSLEDLISEAARQDDPERWTSRFDTLYRGRSLIIDTTIEATPPAGAEPGQYSLSYRVLLGRGPRPARSGRIDLAGFRLFNDQKLAPGDPVLFGARLAGVVLDGREWLIRLESDSGVLITRFDALQRADWDPAQSARASAEQPRLDPDIPLRRGRPR